MWPRFVDKRSEDDRRWSDFVSAVEVVLAFMEAINRHDVEKISALMTEDHVFVDSLGQSVCGRENMVVGWKKYFEFCPDYWLSHEEILEHGRLVAVFGAGGGTIGVGGKVTAENKWRVAAAWLAAVENGLVKERRVYADNKPVYEILTRKHDCFFCGLKQKRDPSTAYLGPSQG
jgi:hypothetical protein